MKAGTGDPVWHTESPSTRVAVIAALELERRTLESALRKRSLVNGREAAIRVYRSGPGPDRAAEAARHAIASGATALVSFGLAGGLRAGAETGTVMLPARLEDAAGAFESDQAWRERLAAVLSADFRVSQATLVSVDCVVTEVAAKQALSRRHGAAAVDMESAALARAAAGAGLPFVALRVIVDGPDDALPDNAESFVTRTGRTRLGGLAGIVASPKRLPALIRLARRSGRARAVLEQVARSIVPATAEPAVLTGATA